MAQAEETWSAGNHVAASCAGMPRMKICETATTVCPEKSSHHCEGDVANTCGKSNYTNTIRLIQMQHGMAD